MNELTRYQDSPVNVLARKVAEYFGGAVALNRDGEYFECSAEVVVPAKGEALGYSLHLSMQTWGAKKGHVKVSISPTDRHRDTNERGISFPSASMDASRPVAKLLADIERRVVNAEAQAALSEYAGRKAQVVARVDSLAKNLAEFLAACPAASISNNFPPDTSSARIFSHGSQKSVHFNGRLYADGSFYFDRIGSVTNDQARRILAILAEA